MKNCQNAKLILIILLTFFSLSALAKWSNEELSFLKTFQADFTNPYLQTVKSLCEKGRYKKSNFKGQYSKYNLKLEQFLEHEFQFNLVLQVKNGAPVKAPLIFVIPGAFTNLDDDQSIMWMQYFSNLGYHVITVPNPWGTDFISMKTKFKMGNFIKEADTLYAAFRATFAHLQQRDLLTPTVHLFGLSYGAFMGSIINSYAARDGFKFTKATFVSPPLNMFKTTNFIDQQIADVGHLEVSGSLLGTLINFNKICKLKNENEASENLMSWAKYLSVKGGFQKEIASSLIEFDSIQDLHIVPGPFSGQRSKWKNEIHFEKYFETFAPELKSLVNSELSKFSYWNKKALSYGAKNLRIMVSDDDFINVKFRKAKDETIVFLTGGGHFGFRNSKWFDQFIAIAF